MDSKFKKNFLKGSAAATIGTVSSMFFHFLSIMMLARNLSKQEFGLYALVLVIAYLFTIAASLGLEYTLVRYAAAGKDKTDSILWPVIILRTLALFVVAVILTVSGNIILGLFDAKLSEYLAIIILMIVLHSFRELLYNYLQGRSLFRKYAGIQIINAVFRVLMIAAVILFSKLSIYNLILIELAAASLSILMLVYFMPKNEIIQLKHNFMKFKEVLKFSMPLYANNLLTFSYDRVTVFMVGLYLTPASVASYDVAGKIPDSFKRIFASFTIVFFPGMSKLLAEGNKDGAMRLMNKSLAVFSGILSLGILVSFLFRKQIITLFFSSAYVDTSLAFALLMVNFYMRALSNIMGYSLVSAGQSAVPMKANLISSAISITGGMIMIPIYGFMGAVYALLIMSIVAQFSYTYYLNKFNMKADSLSYLKPVFILIPVLAAYLLLGVEAAFIKAVIILFFILGLFVVTDELRNMALNRIIRGNIDRLYFRRSKGKNMKIIMVDPLIGNDYAACLSSGLSAEGVEVDLVVPANRKVNVPLNFNLLKWAPIKGSMKGSSAKKFYLYIKYLYRLFWHIIKEQADVVHYQFFRTKLEMVYFLALSFTRTKLVLTAHNILPHERKKLDKFLFSLVYNRAHNIIVHSESIKQKLLSHFDVDDEKIHVIPHGNFDFYLPEQEKCKDDSRNLFQFSEDDNVVLFFGQIREYKGLDILIDAFNIAASENKNIKLLIGGFPAEGKKKYLDLIENSPYKDRIKFFLEFIPVDKVADFFTASDVVVLPYRNIDHSGIVHLACSFSRPIIASNVGDFKETIGQNNLGSVIDSNTPQVLADAIINAFSNYDLLVKQGLKAKQISETKFSWKNIAGLTINMYSRNGLHNGIRSEKFTG